MLLKKLKQIKRKLVRLNIARNKNKDTNISFAEKNSNHYLNIELVASIKNISYDKAKAMMDKVDLEYEVSHSEYVQNHLYIYKTQKGLKRKIKKMKIKDSNFINTICEDTGWTYDLALSKANIAKNKYGLSYRKYAGYRFYALSEEETKAKIRLWSNNAKKNREIVEKATGWSTYEIRKHMKRYETLYDISPSYYILYKAWELSDEQMDSYARQKISEKLWLKYNDKEEMRILAEKDKFNKVYKDYIKRKFWVNVDTNYEEFLEFIDNLTCVFCKPIMFGGGLGTEKFNVEKGKEKELYDLLMSKDRLLVEECVEQHEKVDEFLPGCVNTIRVVVLYKNGICNFICAGMRFGYNGITDNFSKDGMVVDVDLETGILLTDAIDKKGNIYEAHPISNKKFKGFQIPYWDLAKKIAEDAIKFQKGVNYVGWDLAICEDKVVIIEGNSIPDLVLVQAPYAPVKQGKKYLFEPYF